MTGAKHRSTLIAVDYAATAIYLPLVIAPLFLWRWRPANSAWLLVGVYLTAAILVPFCAAYFYGNINNHLRRKRLILGFSVYAFCYLAGNGLGLTGGRWYWLHCTALSLLLMTGMSLRYSPAYSLDKSRTQMILRGHWIFLVTFIAMIEIRAHKSTWMVFDYFWGTYFAWCAWRVPGLKNIEEGEKESPQTLTKKL